MKISVMEVIQDKPFERFMSYFLMQIPMQGLVVHQFQIPRNNEHFRKLKMQKITECNYRICSKVSDQYFVMDVFEDESFERLISFCSCRFQ